MQQAARPGVGRFIQASLYNGGVLPRDNNEPHRSATGQGNANYQNQKKSKNIKRVEMILMIFESKKM